jgi:hypothetical protein
VAPTPYTAEQIRDGHPDGTWLRFLLRRPAAPDVVQVLQFSGADADGVSVESWTETTDGERLAPSTTQRASWPELRDHAAFDAQLSSRERARCNVATGSYDCWLYTVRDSAAAGAPVKLFWFADEKPGPPVLLITRDGDDELFRMELLEHSSDG